MSDLKQEVTEMIHRYAGSVGLSREQVFNPDKQQWNWVIGSARIQIWIETLQFKSGNTRDYLRIFSPLLQIPATDLLTFYRHLLELNDSSLGVKLSIMPGSNWVYATYERDIRGIDYEELVTCIADLEWWADMLDDELKGRFPSFYQAN